MTAANKNEYQNKAHADAVNLKNIADAMNDDPSALNDVDFAHDVDNRLIAGYATIKTYNDFISFQSESDKERYVAEHPVTKFKSLMSVFDVWRDMLTGKYQGHGFVFWILIWEVLKI